MHFINDVVYIHITEKRHYTLCIMHITKTIILFLFVVLYVKGQDLGAVAGNIDQLVDEGDLLEWEAYKLERSGDFHSSAVHYELACKLYEQRNDYKKVGTMRQYSVDMYKKSGYLIDADRMRGHQEYRV